MPLLSRLQQICVAEEATEATAVAIATLFSDAVTDANNPEYNSSYLALDPSLDYDVELYERKIKQATLTPSQALVGAKLGKCSFGLEMTSRNLPTGATGASVTNIATAYANLKERAPSFDRPLRACGMRREACFGLTAGTITNGPFLHGETITRSDAVTATVMGNTYNGQTYIYITQEHGLGTGTITGAVALVWTGATSGATFTSSAADTLGAMALTASLVWFPFSYPLTQITFDATGLEDAVAVGDVIQGVTSGAIGIVFYAAAAAVDQLVYIRRISGHFTTAEVIKRITPNADADLGNLAATGFEKQFTVPTLSIGMGKDGVREALYGCRGNWKLAGNIGEPAIFTFDFNGAKHSGAPVDGPNVASSFFDRVPPVLLGANMQVGKTSLTYAQEILPCINAFTLDAGIQAEFRRCMSSASGVEEALLVARKITGTIDPELLPESLFDWMGQFLANGIERIRFGVGTTIPDLFTVQLHNASISAAPTADRNGIATRNISFGLHSGSQGISSGDNEMVIFWRRV